MQLDNKKSIRSMLTAATCSLLGASQTSAEETPWQLDTAFLYYDEGDRVTAVEPVISAKKAFADDSKLSLKLVLDSLTGASHNGASVSDQPQTFTGPSGDSGYTIEAGDIPLDDTFKDSRVAVSAQWTQPVNRLLTYSVGGNFSKEFDFNSYALNGSVSRDFNKRNTTLNAGLSYENDTISPQGGVPQEYSIYTDAIKLGGDESKSVVDFLIGVTQVINRKTIMQFNVGYSSSSGYLNDPYKIVSIIDGTGETRDYAYEQRPDSRKKTSLYWKTKHHLSENVVDVSYRYMTDDWGVRSHTLDFKYRWQGENFYIEPHLRYYTQTQADFYRVYLETTSKSPAPIATDLFPSDVSADYRLSDLDTSTLGIKAAFLMSESRELSFRVEYYDQQGSTKPAELDAIIFQMGYKFDL